MCLNVIVPEIVIQILKLEELSCLPDYNREDAVASITAVVCRNLKVSIADVGESVLRKYRSEFKLSDADNSWLLNEIKTIQ